MKFKRGSQYFSLGLTILGVLCIGILLWVIVTNFPGFVNLCKRGFQIISPVVYGIIFAYMLNPIMVATESHLLPVLRKWNLKEKRVRSLGRALSVIFSLIVAALVIYGFFALLLPNLVDSVTGIVANMPAYYEKAQIWVQDLAAKHPEYADIINTVYDKVYDGIVTWFETSIVGNMDSLVVTVTTQVFGVVKGAMNLLIGIVASIYMLLSKEKFLAQIKKLVVAFMKRSKADRLFEVCAHSNKMFSGFISGKILDSMIIGVLCYIGMSILKLPYSLLVSTIVGITNVIPFFGPFIGAIPSALLILLVDPLQAVYFCLFILGLQQLDGNVIGPYILGDAVGLPSFWILVSITIFGGLFGFVGMLFGVPVFAVIYMLIREFVELRLEEKGAPVSTSYYYHVNRTSDLENVQESKKTNKKQEHDITEEELKQAEEEFWK